MFWTSFPRSATHCNSLQHTATQEHIPAMFWTSFLRTSADTATHLQIQNTNTQGNKIHANIAARETQVQMYGS